MKETVLSKKCLKWVKENYPNVLVVNIHSGGWSNKGFPDYLVVVDGRLIAVELKSDTGYKQQVDQKIWEHRLNKAGAPYYLPHSFEEFKTIIESEVRKCLR